MTFDEGLILTPAPEASIQAREPACHLKVYRSSILGQVSIVAYELNGRGYLAGTRLNAAQATQLRDALTEFLDAA